MTDHPIAPNRAQEIAETLARYNKPLLISLTVMTALAQDVLGTLPKTVTLYLMLLFPIVFCWLWARATGLKSWRDGMVTTAILLLWAMFMLFAILVLATRDDPQRARLCRSYLKVMATTPIATPGTLPDGAVDRMNAAASAASALKCW
jgi:ABC-type uncharacterized transport system permease subunit